MTLSVRNTLQDRNLLLTGATGFLGKVVAAHLLEEVPGVRLGWVVRGDPAAQAERLATLFSTSPAFRALRERHGEDWPRWISERVQAIAGNLGEDQLGVEDHVLRGYDAVLNIGGLVDFDPDPVEAFQTNVEGARNAARAAAHTQHRVLIHVSTCFVVGTREGEVDEVVSDSDPTGRPWDVAATVERLRGLLVEVSDPRARRDIVRALARERGFPNVYTFSKALGEHLANGEPTVQTVVVRPAVVECAVSSPFPGWNEGATTTAPLAWLLGTPFRAFPARHDARFDVVPVDRVARGLIVALAAALEDRCPAVIQLGSSDVNPLRFDRAVELTALGLRRHHSLAGNEPWRRVGVELEAYPVGWKAQPWWQSGGLKGLIGFAADKLPGGAGLAAHQLGKGLGKLEKVLAMFKPFVHDHDWGFRTDNIRRLDGLLSAEERALFGWDVPTLDWRRYWVDVQVPGLVKWCFPVLEGREVPQDAQRHALPAIAVLSRSAPDPVSVEVHAA